MVKRKDIEIDKRQIGYVVTSHYGDVEEGFFSTLKEAKQFVKVISKGVTPQELHKRVVGRFEPTKVSRRKIKWI